MTFVDNTEAELRALLALEAVGEDRFRIAPVPSPLLRLYGGQLVAQAIAAIERTVPPDKPMHSCHAYYGHPGLIDVPLDLAVTRDRDGRSFAARRVTIEQDGRLLLTMAASLHAREDGTGHQVPMPEVAPPETLRPLETWIADLGEAVPVRHRPFWSRVHLFDWRPCQPFHMADFAPEPPRQHFWFRLRPRAAADQRTQRALLGYASDLHVLHVALQPRAQNWAGDYMQLSSLDHAIWFYGDVALDDWHLYTVESPVSGDARALGRGLVYTRDGRLVAAVSQEGLIRELDAPRTGKL